MPTFDVFGVFCYCSLRPLMMQGEQICVFRRHFLRCSGFERTVNPEAASDSSDSTFFSCQLRWCALDEHLAQVNEVSFW